MVILTCVDCHTAFEHVSRRPKRCKQCHRLHRNAAARASKAASKAVVDTIPHVTFHKPCVECGSEITCKSATKLRCDSCQKEHRRLVCKTYNDKVSLEKRRFCPRVHNLGPDRPDDHFEKCLRLVRTGTSLELVSYVSSRVQRPLFLEIVPSLISSALRDLPCSKGKLLVLMELYVDSLRAEETAVTHTVPDLFPDDESLPQRADFLLKVAKGCRESSNLRALKALLYPFRIPEKLDHLLSTINGPAYEPESIMLLRQSFVQ